jgi:hypothetical protein
MSALAAIHVAKKQFGLDEDTYRAVLVRVTGKGSTREMSEAERQRVVEEFRKRGFQKASNGSRKPLEGRFAKKLQALWIAGWNLGVFRSREDSALVEFVRHQTKIDHVRFLRHAEDARSVIEALKAWMAREAGVDWSESKFMPDWLRSPGAKIAVAQWQILARAGAVDGQGFRKFVMEKARQVDLMTDRDWMPVMNALGEMVRKVRQP